MKRLRAPEQSESKPAGPVAGAPTDPAAPQAATDPPLSSAAAPEGTSAVVTEPPAVGETSKLAPEAEATVAAPAEEPRQPSPDPQGGEPTTRCNGEASAALHTAAEDGGEQG